MVRVGAHSHSAGPSLHELLHPPLCVPTAQMQQLLSMLSTLLLFPR